MIYWLIDGVIAFGLPEGHKSSNINFNYLLLDDLIREPDYKNSIDNSSSHNHLKSFMSTVYDHLDRGTYPLYLTTNLNPSHLLPYLNIILQNIGYTPLRALELIREVAPNFFGQDLESWSVEVNSFALPVRQTKLTMRDSMISLYLLIKTLRSRCPWDKTLTSDSLLPLTWEEVTELWEAVKQGEVKGIKEEIGDVLLHLFLHTAMLEEKGKFTPNSSGMAEIISVLINKIVRRHPHVFAEDRVDSPEGAINSWNKRKVTEKEGILPDTNDNYEYLVEGEVGPSALINALRVQEIAKKRGFDFIKREEVMNKVEEELKELKDSLNCKERSEIELGDLLFSVVNLSRHLGVDPEGALRESTQKFKKRYLKLNQLVDNKDKILDPYELDNLWEDIKNKEKEDLP